MSHSLAALAADLFDFSDTERLLMTMPLADVVDALESDERPTMPPAAMVEA